MNPYQITDSNTTEWRKSTFAEGVEVKDLGKANGREMQLVRFTPGTTFPLHVHRGPEFVFLLEGEAYDQGQQLRPGWAVVAATGTTHESFHGLPVPDCLFGVKPLMSLLRRQPTPQPALRPTARLFVFCSFLLALLSACAAPPARKDFVGTYEGESIDASPTGQSFVLRLDVAQRNGIYSLTGSMNDTNREEGMDHTSNTHWQWTGTGTVHNHGVTFLYEAHDAEPGKGTLRREGTDLTLTLDRVQYRLHLSKQ